MSSAVTDESKKLPNKVIITKKVFQNHMVIADITVNIESHYESTAMIWNWAKNYVEQEASVGLDANDRLGTRSKLPSTRTTNY